MRQASVCSWPEQFRSACRVVGSVQLRAFACTRVPVHEWSASRLLSFPACCAGDASTWKASRRPMPAHLSRGRIGIPKLKWRRALLVNRSIRRSIERS
jgi:hypothetical protein